jgi:flavin-dependent thymidylate synthase
MTNIEFKPIEVKLLGSYGSDRMIAEQAWYSTDKDKGEDTTGEHIYKILNTLITRKHTKALEVVDFHFEAHWPISCDRQQQTHRTQRASIARSGRYGSAPMAMVEPSKELVEFRIAESYKHLANTAFEVYTSAVECGVECGVDSKLMPERRVRELFRDLLPQGQMTSRRFKIDLHNFVNYLAQRRTTHAQYEIAVAAQKMLDAAWSVCPIAFSILDENKLIGTKIF